MMNSLSIEVEDLGQVKKKLNITLPTEVVNREIKAAYQSLKSSASIAGFRKGAIPMSILKSRFGEQVAEDVKVKLIESSYPQAMNEKKLVPVVAPKIELGSPKVVEGADFSYSVTVEVAPDVVVEGYRGMELKQEPINVSEADIDEGLKRLAESRSEIVESNRPAKTGDYVTVDFEATIDKEPVKGGKGSNYTCIIGERTLLDGFDTALIGASKDETVETNLTFPESYSEGSLGGKSALFKIIVKAVKEKRLNAIDEEFAKDMQFEDMGKLRDYVSVELKKVKESNDKERLKNSILSKLIEKHQFEVPDALVKKYLGLLLGRIVENMRQGIFNEDDRGLKPEALASKYLPLAVRHVKEDIILDCIAAKEEIQIPKEELEAALRHLAELRGQAYEAFVGSVERQGALDVIRDGLKHEKVFDMIIASANNGA
ncbi:MAG: trigger factor [Deltaproteobacteria bacterium]|jgi:trigger factor